MSGPLRFNRYDRIATVFIAVALLVVFLVVSLWDDTPEKVTPPTAGQLEELHRFEVTSSDTARKTAKASKSVKVQLHRFDPNTVDSSRLVSMGLPRFVARNVVRYRNAGGRFRKPEDLSRIYGMKPEDFRRLAPYIVIPQEKKNESKPRAVQHTVSQGKIHDGETVDLNCGDTAVFKRVPGVGSTFAKRIVSYGKLLGGYVSPQQVTEVYGMPADMAKWFRVECAAPEKINLNTATFAEMLRHPYLNKKQVEAIVRYRDMHGRLSSLSQMRLGNVFTADEENRLVPYIEF